MREKEFSKLLQKDKYQVFLFNCPAMIPLILPTRLAKSPKIPYNTQLMAEKLSSQSRNEVPGEELKLDALAVHQGCSDNVGNLIAEAYESPSGVNEAIRLLERDLAMDSLEIKIKLMSRRRRAQKECIEGFNSIKPIDPLET